MRPRRGCAELLGRDVVNPNQANARVGEELCGVRSDVSKIAMKGGRPHPPAQRASCSEYHSRSALPIVSIELSGIDGLDAIGNLDDPRWSDQRLDRHVVDRRSIAHEMHWSIDVGAA